MILLIIINLLLLGVLIKGYIDKNVMVFAPAGILLMFPVTALILSLLVK